MTPLIYLHSSMGEHWGPPFLDPIKERFEVICPVQPGFGEDGGIDEIDDIEDLAFYYADLLDKHERVHLAGTSTGGWIAAEVAVRWPQKIESLTLMSPVGIWVDEYPIAPMWGIQREELAELLFADQQHPLAQMIRSIDLDNPPPEEVMLPFINQQTAIAKIAWNPYMHNRKLARRLHRIKSPTLLIWGQDDRMVSPEYGKRYAELIPGSRLETVPGGHMAALESPEKVGQLISTFL